MHERREEIIRRLDRLDLRKSEDDCPVCGHRTHYPKPCTDWVPNHHFGGGLDKRCPCDQREDA